MLSGFGWQNMTAAKHYHLLGFGSVRVLEFKEVFATIIGQCFSHNTLRVKWAATDKCIFVENYLEGRIRILPNNRNEGNDDELFYTILIVWK